MYPFKFEMALMNLTQNLSLKQHVRTRAEPRRISMRQDETQRGNSAMVLTLSNNLRYVAPLAVHLLRRL